MKGREFSSLTNRHSYLRQGMDVQIGCLKGQGLLSEREEVEIRTMTKPVLDDAKFCELPASRLGKHHFYIGGLQCHTREVLKTSISQLMGLPDVSRVNWVVLFVGAVWHDYGKVREYAFRPDFRKDLEIEGWSHGQELKKGDVVYALEDCGGHHITLGAAEFGRRMGSYFTSFESDPTARKILHAIESHHGRREWGSPHVPRTVEALAIHQADMLSVMWDCGINPAERRH